MNFAALFEEQIRVQQRAIRSSELWAVGFFVLGVLVIVLSVLVKFDRGFAVETIKLGGGMFLGGLSFYQIKDIIPRRERIASYSYLKRAFEDTEHLPPGEQVLLVQLAMDTLKETTRR